MMIGNTTPPMYYNPRVDKVNVCMTPMTNFMKKKIGEFHSLKFTIGSCISSLIPPKLGKLTCWTPKTWWFVHIDAASLFPLGTFSGLPAVNFRGWLSHNPHWPVLNMWSNNLKNFIIRSSLEHRHPRGLIYSQHTSQYKSGWNMHQPQPGLLEEIAHVTIILLV